MAAVIHPSEQGQNKGYVITKKKKIKARQSLNTIKNNEKKTPQPCLTMAATTGTPHFCTVPGISQRIVKKFVFHTQIPRYFAVNTVSPLLCGLYADGATHITTNGFCVSENQALCYNSVKICSSRDRKFMFRPNKMR